MKNRIPTKINLNRRRVLEIHRTYCVFFVMGSNGGHLFTICGCAYNVWMKVLDWLCLEVVLPPTIPELYVQCMGVFGKKETRKRGLVVWHAMVWTLWLKRNDIIFNNGELEMDSLL